MKHKPIRQNEFEAELTKFEADKHRDTVFSFVALPSKRHPVGKCKYYIPFGLPDAGSRILFSDPDNQRGFDGDTVKIRVQTWDGIAAVDLVGPWRTNPDALLEDTGIDLRMFQYNRGAIGFKKTRYDHGVMLEDVLYVDPEPVISDPRRIRWMAEQIAEFYEKDVYYFIAGGLNGEVKGGE